jgi:hypothetical protein
METDNSKSVSRKSKGIKDIVKALSETRPGTHSIVVYPDLVTFREIYVPFTKLELGRNQIVLMLSHYETVDNVLQYLSNSGFNVQDYLDSGSLLILDARQAFFTDGVDDPMNGNGNIVTLMRIIQTQANKLRKDGVTIIVDLGCFFPFAGTNHLIKYEKSIPKMFRNSSLKQLCTYHQRDFDQRFSPSEMANLLDQHGRSILMMDS